MGDKRKLLELDIDIEAIIAKSTQLKSELDTLRASQNELKKSGDTSSESYVKLAAQISKVSSEYNLNQKQLANLAQVSDKYLNVNQKVNLALDQENNSISAARQNNAELIKIRDQLNLSKESEKKLADEINTKLDDNNKFIKENVSQREQQVLGIGGYKDAITGAIQETGLFSGQLSGLKSVYETSLKVISPFKNDIYTTATGMRNAAAETEGLNVAQKGLAIATNLGTGAMRVFTLALAATGIGLIIAAIALLINGLSKLDPVMDFFEQATAGVGAAIDKASQIVVRFVSNITSIGDAFSKIGKFMSDPIGSIKNFAEEVGNAAKAAAKLKEAEQELNDLKDIYEVRNKNIESQINLDKIRLKSKDLTAKEEQEIEKRINENYEKLSKNKTEVNDKNLNLALQSAINTAQELNKVDQKRLEDSIRFGDLEVANKLLNDGKITANAYDKLKEATNSVIDSKNQQAEAEERTQDKIEKARAKAEENARKVEEAQNKRREEAAKLVDKAIAQSKTELEIFIASQGIRVKSLEEEVALAEKVRDKKLEIAKKEFEARKISEKEYQLQTLNIQNDFLKKQADVAVAFADQELKNFIANNRSKIDANKFLSDELVAQEKQRLNDVAEAEAKALTKRLEAGLINAQQYDDGVRAIDKKYEDDKKLLEESKKAAELEKNAIDLENKLVINQNDLDLQIQKLQAERDAELASAEKTEADVNLIKKKYLLLEEALKAQNKINKLNIEQQYVDAIGGLTGQLFGESKALTTALTLADTYFAAQKAYLSQFLPIPDLTSPARGSFAAGAAVATGLVNVAKINKVKLAKGAIDLDGPGTGTSDSIPAMLSKGESVITAEATSNNKELLQAINANAGIDFSKQYLPSSVVNIYSQNSTAPGIDYDLLAAKVAQANLNLPKPVVYTAITDINAGQKDYANIVNGADL